MSFRKDVPHHREESQDNNQYDSEIFKGVTRQFCFNAQEMSHATGQENESASSREQMDIEKIREEQRHGSCWDDKRMTRLSR